MSAASASPIASLSQTGEHRHLVQFYENDQEMSSSVAAFILEGIKAGDSALLICTAFHRDLIIMHWRQQSIPVAEYLADGRLHFYDAHTVLDLIMSGQQVSETQFHTFIKSKLERTLSRFPRVRAFGELVNILASRGNDSAVESLEKMWDGLLRDTRVSLLCGYSTDVYAHNERKKQKERVCGLHDHVLAPPEANRRSTTEVLEEEIMRLRSELALSQKVASLGEISASLSHELNGPLTVLMLGLEQFKIKLAKEGNATDDLFERVYRSGTRLGELVQNVRALSQAVPVSVEHFLLSAMVQSAVLFAGDKITKSGVSLEIDCSKEPIQLTANRVALEQVLINLLQNAVDAIAEVGRISRGLISLHAGLDPVNPQNVKITMRDNGGGIEPEKLETIFQAFFTTKAGRGGTGLGLSICRRILEQHGGTITCESKLGVGTTFTVLFPLYFNHLTEN